MVKIFSPASGGSDIGAALADLGRQMFGNRTASEFNREKLRAAQRENVETEAAMAQIAQQGAHTLGSDPIMQARLFGSGYDPSKFANLGLMGAATGFGARDPRTQNWQVGAGQSFDNTAGAFDARLGETRRNNDLQSADRRYGVDQSIGQQMFEFKNIGADQAADNAEAIRNNDIQSADRRYGVDVGSRDTMAKFNLEPKPVLGPNGQPTFVPQGNVVASGAAPILSEADQKGTLLGQNFDNLPALNPQQQQVLGARVDGNKTGTPRNYVLGNRSFITFDGVTDAQTGQPLPPGGFIGSVEGSASDVGVTNAVQTDLQSDVIANKRFNFLIDQGMSLTQDPTLFGPQGLVRSLGQELMAGAGGVAQLFAPGQPGNGALREAQVEVRNAGLAGLLPELYDPNLPKVQTIWGLLVYSGASALAGQENRSVSDKDVIAMQRILGNPQSLFSSAEMMRSKLDTARQIVGQFDAISREALGGNAPVAPAAGAAPPPSAAPAPAPAPAGGVERWQRGPDGRPQRVQ